MTALQGWVFPSAVLCQYSSFGRGLAPCSLSLTHDLKKSPLGLQFPEGLVFYWAPHLRPIWTVFALKSIAQFLVLRTAPRAKLASLSSLHIDFGLIPL